MTAFGGERLSVRAFELLRRLGAALHELDADAVVNCAGLGARELAMTRMEVEAEHATCAGVRPCLADTAPMTGNCRFHSGGSAG